MSKKIYDVIVIGGGAAGMSAGIYSGRAKMKTLVLEQGSVGGQAKTTNEIVNYPGIRHTTGPELMEQMHLQAEDFGVAFAQAEVLEAQLEGEIKVLKTTNGDYETRSVIIATGATPRTLGFPGEAEYRGRGVAYCATCDGEFYTGLEVFVIGAGFAAAEEAIFLTRFARKVTVIAREPEFTCAKTIADKVLAHPKIEVKFNTEVVEATGDELLRRVKFINNQTNETFEHVAQDDETFGIFIFAGYVPQTKVFNGLVDMDKFGYIITDENMHTSVEGVYAAGDLRPKVLRQVVTAVADGAIASLEAEKYVAHEKERLGIVEEEVEVAPQPKEVKEEKAPAKEVAKGGQSALLNDALRGQIAGILGRMENNVTLVTIVDPANAKSIELRDLVMDIANLGDKLEAIVKTKGEDVALEEKVNADKFPVVALLDQDGNYAGVKFHGVPGGHELNSFLLAIYNLAGPGQALDAQVLEAIKSLDKKVNIKVAVSLSCHLCPDVVVSAQRIAIENPNVEAEMLDIANFPELKTKHKVMSVPCMIVNDEKIAFGSKSIQEMLNLIA
ncbi:MAG: FAD-dependent oxidoreductase [Turicibacter sp.]|uniref:Thioredoxin reductase n=1 Tax=Turicibacter faecis TaxID=2963365 RepID=A0ABM8IP46_9FIRM|nr:FAD-dependent oxidoreductase [Turicibacter sp. 1E2]MCI8701151.1 FAD-dependent oxidoreductase [Turicibacter sp.]MCI9350692.1 FAD-dependent oxidoreductase [Turicibacter sp.]MCU7208697.1 FAD-dependent oxidoreductase [Turicibacter sp. 1E2]BEH91567.1 thioredoxin reductase [Turicibacter sp. TC023]